MVNGVDIALSTGLLRSLYIWQSSWWPPKAEEALRQLRMIMGRLKLMVKEEKTRICKVPEGEFDFLGYTFGRMYSFPQRRAIYRECQAQGFS
jgi:hypothetical protein